MERWIGAAALAAAAASGIALGGLRDVPPRQTERKLLLLRWALAAAIGTDVGALLLLARRLAASGGALWQAALAALCLALTALALLRPVSLFPEESGALILSDQSQQKRFTLCLLQLTAAFALCGGWLLRLLRAGPGGEAGALGDLLFAAAAQVCLLWIGRQSIRSAYERIETLVDQQYQAELLNFMQVIRSQRHDFNFHMQAVAGMVESGRYEDCKGYVREMVKNAEKLNDVLPLKNPIISALVNAFQELAAARDIRLEVQVLSQLEDLPCTIYEINSVLGNFLQNTIDELEDKPPEDRWIHLLIMKRSRRYLIKVSNPCARVPEDCERLFRVGFSTKRSHEGIGLVSVRRIAAKYGGAAYLEHDPGVIHFIAKIPEKAAG